MDDIIDAHVHFNLKNDDPLLDLISQMKKSYIVKALVILNTKQEQEYCKYLVEQSKIDDISNSINFAFGLDFRDSNQISYLKKFFSGYSTGVYKLHPRLTDIKRENFLDVAHMLDYIPARIVLIDCFGYGHHIENHIGVELGIYLAQRFPDVSFVLCHSGGENILKCMLYTRTLSNIFYDISLTCTYLKNSSVHNDIVNMLKYNYTKVMFGSDYPDFTPQTAIDSLSLLCRQANLDYQKQKDIFFTNANCLYFSDCFKSEVK